VVFIPAKKHACITAKQELSPPHEKTRNKSDWAKIFYKFYKFHGNTLTVACILFACI